MKTAMKLLASSALIASSVSPFFASAALADVIPAPVADPLSSTNLTEMQNTCDALADARDTGNGDIWSARVLPGATTLVAGPTEVAGTRVVDQGTITPTGTYVPSSTEIRFGDKNGPFKIGGSVNMFGDQWSTAGYYPDSTYYYDADFNSTFSHGYTCEISRSEYHAGYTQHVEAVGAYVVYGDFGGSEDAVRGQCAAFTNQGFPIESRPSWWGVNLYEGGNTDPNSNGYAPHCIFDGVLEHDEVVPERWDPPVVVDTLPQTAILQDQTDSMRAFEDHGGRVNVTGEYKIGQVVVCISPSSTTKKGVPGAWRPQNGYGGGNMLESTPASAGCNTEWFKVTGWGSGSQTSNGTYISVPFYVLP